MQGLGQKLAVGKGLTGLLAGASRAGSRVVLELEFSAQVLSLSTEQWTLPLFSGLAACSWVRQPFRNTAEVDSHAMAARLAKQGHLLIVVKAQMWTFVTS